MDSENDSTVLETNSAKEAMGLADNLSPDNDDDPEVPVKVHADYDKAAHIDEETLIAREKDAVSALNEFLSKNHFVGFDNLDPHLRQGVNLMQELQGHDTGMSLHHLVHGEHPSMNMADNKKEGIKKRLQNFLNFLKWLSAMEEIMDAMFDKVYEVVSGRIEEIKEHIDDRIEKVDAKLEEAIEEAIAEGVIPSKEALVAGTAVASTAAGAVALKKIEKAKKKKKKLWRFKKRVEKHEAILEEADSTQEVLAVHENLEQDFEDLSNNKYSSSNAMSNTSSTAIVSSLVDSYSSEKDYCPSHSYESSFRYHDIEPHEESDDEGEEENIDPPLCDA